MISVCVSAFKEVVRVIAYECSFALVEWREEDFRSGRKKLWDEERKPRGSASAFFHV